jgi:acetyl-CoA carboxylase biotin carboxyl carrier protein
VEEFKHRISDLADLMEEYRLSSSELAGKDWRIAFRRRSSSPAPVQAGPGPEVGLPIEALADEEAEEAEKFGAASPAGVPISSPMTGIFYPAPSPSSPPFVKEGESVEIGQVVGLIEAMKVFNEITASVSGTVTQVVAESGQVVQPGEPLLFIA